MSLEYDVPERPGVTLSDGPAYDDDFDEDSIESSAPIPLKSAFDIPKPGRPPSEAYNRSSVQSFASSLRVTNWDDSDFGDSGDENVGVVAVSGNAKAVYSGELLPSAGVSEPSIRQVSHDSSDEDDLDTSLSSELQSPGHSQANQSYSATDISIPSLVISDDSIDTRTRYQSYPQLSARPHTPISEYSQPNISNQSRDPSRSPRDRGTPLTINDAGQQTPQSYLSPLNELQDPVASSPPSPGRRQRLSSAFKAKLRIRSPSAGSHRSNRHRSASDAPSIHVPENMPAAEHIPGLGQAEASAQESDEYWERRAMILASKEVEVDSTVSSHVLRSNAKSVSSSAGDKLDAPAETGGRSRSPSFGTQQIEAELQKAIDLHEQGDLAGSSKLLARLADPDGDNHPLAQVLYGLALRHGWGVEKNPDEAIVYLRFAASNSALIEEEAKKANVKVTSRNRKTGAGGARGELTLAIFELANCFRYGWGVEVDPVAAKQYYETAANLGDPDAMTETAWCLLTGFGCKKDKFMAAQFYRMAEGAGKVEVGSSWIWKDKYNPSAENIDKMKASAEKKHRFRKH